MVKIARLLGIIAGVGILAMGCGRDRVNHSADERPIAIPVGASCEQQAIGFGAELERLVSIARESHDNPEGRSRLDQIVSGLLLWANTSIDPVECTSLAADAGDLVPFPIVRDFYYATSSDADLLRAVDSDEVFRDGTAIESLFAQIVRDVK